MASDRAASNILRLRGNELDHIEKGERMRMVAELEAEIKSNRVDGGGEAN